jgi:integrase
MYRVAKGEDPQAEHKAQRISGTFQELADRYRAHAMKRNKSWRQADYLIRANVLPRWSKLHAANITRADVKTLIAGIEAPSTANQVLASASAIFAWALKEEVAGVRENPCRMVERHPLKSRERVLSDSELPQFWAAFDDAGLVRSTALKLILLTGQRPGEVRHMRAEHIQDHWWTMPGEPVKALGWPGTKNHQSHRLWLSKTVLELIGELDGDGLLLAGTRGKPVSGLDKAMRSICRSLGVEAATPHDLRRTFSSRVTGLGFGRDALNRVTNHREGGIADVYDRHQYAEENKRVMEAVASHILEIATGTPDAGKVVVSLRR